MALKSVENFIPGPDTTGVAFDPTQIDTSRQFPLGTMVRVRDTSLNSYGTVIYARGVASVTAGDACILKAGDNAAILLDDGTAGAEIGALVGWALAAVVAGNYGWFQIEGRVTAKVASGFAADNLIYATTTAGTVDDAAGGGQVLGARSESAIGTPAAGQAYIDVFFPRIAGTSAGLA